MAISVADNFDHKSKKPLDARTSYTTLAQMKAVTDANMNEGCFAYCVETDKYYTFKSTNTVDDTLGKWREYGVEEMPSEDMADIITPLPSARPAYHKYSTEEQIVGEWINGKPIYEITVYDIEVTDTTETKGTIINIPFLDVGLPLDLERVISLEQVYNADNSATQDIYFSSSAVMTTRTVDNTLVIRTRNITIDVYNKQIQALNSMGYNLKVTFTVQYTKTTD